MRILLPLIAILIASCSDQKSNPIPTNTEPSAVQKMPELSTGSKSKFIKISKLPAGIDSIFGKSPSKEMGYYKFSFPRTDLHVTLDGVNIDPRLAFTSWIAFKPMDTLNSEVMMMGDIVLLESEFRAVLKKLDQRGIDISAIHNHLLNEKPKIMYLHVMAMGAPVDLSAKMKEVFQLTATPLLSASSDTSTTMNWGKVEDIIGVKGKREGSILKIGIPRIEKIKEEGMELPENFGINSTINFQKVGEKAAVTGDFVLIGTEVNTVQKILGRAGMLVTAVHSHMLFEDPRLFFIHFWGVDDPEKIATAIHEVLVNSKHQLQP